MSLVRVGPKHQITIPKAISAHLHVEPGDVLEADVRGSQIVLSPKRLVDRAPMPALSAEERRLLQQSQKKINRIRTNLLHSKGLTNKEMAVAVKAGLLPEDQAWWWHERWQQLEREAERDIQKGMVKRYNSTEELVKDLRRATQARRKS